MGFSCARLARAPEFASPLSSPASCWPYAVLVGCVSRGSAAATDYPLRTVSHRFDDLSAAAVGSNPEAAARFFAEETDRWRAVIRAADVKLE
jgi:hypothetical protein